jgi:hypothetical protein
MRRWSQGKADVQSQRWGDPGDSDCVAGQPEVGPDYSRLIWPVAEENRGELIWARRGEAPAGNGAESTDGGSPSAAISFQDQLLPIHVGWLLCFVQKPTPARPIRLGILLVNLFQVLLARVHVHW